MYKNNQDAILRHCANVERLYGPFILDKIDTFKRLRRAERRVNRATERLANGEITDEQFDAIAERARVIVYGLFADSRAITRDLWIDSDPRGYALKLGDDMRHAGIFTDWGGRAILAPDYKCL